MFTVWLGVTGVLSALFWAAMENLHGFSSLCGTVLSRRVQRSRRMIDQIKCSWCLLMLGLVSQRM